jgi:hypothetical protein
MGPNEFYVHDLMMMMIPGVEGSSFVVVLGLPPRLSLGNDPVGVELHR